MYTQHIRQKNQAHAEKTHREGLARASRALICVFRRNFCLLQLHFVPLHVDLTRRVHDAMYFGWNRRWLATSTVFAQRWHPGWTVEIDLMRPRAHTGGHVESSHLRVRAKDGDGRHKILLSLASDFLDSDVVV